MVVIGHVHFDTPQSGNIKCEVLSKQEAYNLVFRNKYVKITKKDYPKFIGRIVEGPFFVPEEVGRDSAFAQTTIIKGDEFKATPNFYVMSRVEILGETSGSGMGSTNKRPLPKSQVDDLTEDEVRKILGVSGDMLLGNLVGYDNVRVTMDAEAKKILPRNIGIFGTVGSGKTNTSQVLIEEASKSKYAVVVIDVEGEYTEMDKPMNEKRLEAKLAKYKLSPTGLKNFTVYYPAGSEKPRPDAREFDINFGSINPWVLAEMANLTEAQEGIFFKVIDKLQKDRHSKKKDNESEAIEFLEGKDFEESSYTIQQFFRVLFGEENGSSRGDKRSVYALARQIGFLNRTGIFDKKKGQLNIDNLLKPGHVSIIDVSTIQNDGAKNIVIAWILEKIFNKKLKDKEAPKTLVVIEEAHTFVSRDAVTKMRSTMDTLKLIARRGRKRWMCLAFISQQPSHLPDEIFELCNTRIIHNTKSEFNLGPLKHTSGDVINEIWNMVPGLGPGQAVITSPQFNHTIMVDMRPSVSRRKLVE